MFLRASNSSVSSACCALHAGRHVAPRSRREAGRASSAERSPCAAPTRCSWHACSTAGSARCKYAKGRGGSPTQTSPRPRRAALHASAFVGTSADPAHARQPQCFEIRPAEADPCAGVSTRRRP
eukprot:2984648-Prymnesium_polylepis.1